MFQSTTIELSQEEDYEFIVREEEQIKYWDIANPTQREKGQMI